ncbi:hypothetical protein Tco_1530685 [Tanacetum coccineum]
MVEDLDNYHLKELRCSTQCHTQKTLWIIARGDERLILWWGIEYLEICLEHKFSTPWNECFDNEDELQSFRHKAQQQNKIYEEREESCWIMHLRTGIFYPKGHERVMNEVPDGAAISASSYWLRNNDMYRV